MKVLCIGDLHGKKSNIEKVEKVLKQALKLEKEADLVVFLGDLNDTKAIIRSEVQNLYLKYIKKFTNTIYILVGNHDFENSIECGDHSLECLKEYVQIVDVPKAERGCLFLPYYNNLEKFKEDIKKYPDEEYLFMHQGVDGVLYSNGHQEISDLKKKDLKRFKRVIAGHIHKEQKVDNIVYVGSAFTQSFGETFEEKNLLILDTKENTTKTIPTDISKHTVVDYKIVKIDDVKELKESLKQYKNNIVQLRVSCPESISSKIKMSLFKGCNLDSLKVSPIREDKPIMIKSTLSNEEMMKIYINNLDVKYNKDELFEISKKILEEVK